MAETKDVAVRQEAQPPVPLEQRFEMDAGAGMEEAGMEARPTPFLRILQDLSPMVKETNSEYIAGAKTGMFVNLASRELFDGSKGVLLVPFYYRQVYCEWRPDGGGFAGEHQPKSDTVMASLRDAQGSLDLKTGDGNNLHDTRYHYCVQVFEDDPSRFDPALVALAVSQLKYSKRLMAEIMGLKFDKAGGGKFNPPSYSSIYRATTKLDKNQRGQEYWSWDFNRVKTVSNESLYEFSAKLRKDAAAGMLRADTESLEREAEGAAGADGDAGTY